MTSVAWICGLHAVSMRQPCSEGCWAAWGQPPAVLALRTPASYLSSLVLSFPICKVLWDVRVLKETGRVGRGLGWLVSTRSSAAALMIMPRRFAGWQADLGGLVHRAAEAVGMGREDRIPAAQGSCGFPFPKVLAEPLRVGGEVAPAADCAEGPWTPLLQGCRLRRRLGTATPGIGVCF